MQTTDLQLSVLSKIYYFLLIFGHKTKAQKPLVRYLGQLRAIEKLEWVYNLGSQRGRRIGNMSHKEDSNERKG